MSDDREIRVLFWDVRVGGDRRLPLIERIDADILLLLAVSKPSARRWSERWNGRWHSVAGVDLHESWQKQPHGAMIASRWRLQEPRALEGFFKPERTLAVTTQHPSGPIRLLSWGTPNASGDTAATKLADYRLMSEHLQRRDDAVPTILGVDTNSWFDPPGPAEHDPDWVDEHRFVDRDPPHGLTDVHRHLVDEDPHRRALLEHLRPHGPLDPTFIRRPTGEPNRLASSIDEGPSWGLDRMDRLYVSSHWQPLACEHLYNEARDAGGDHAALIADLRLA